MTVSKMIEITCNKCYTTEKFMLHVLRDRSIDSMLKNRGYTEEYHGIMQGKTHWCSDCNDREKETFYVVDGYGEEYLGEVEAWGIVNARSVAWDTFDCENMVYRERSVARERADAVK